MMASLSRFCCGSRGDIVSTLSPIISAIRVDAEAPVSNPLVGNSDGNGGGESEALSVKVVVRVRGLIAREALAKEAVVLLGDTAMRLENDLSGASKGLSAQERTFSYDAVLGPAATQAATYSCVAAPVLRRVLSGYNGCIFAYGQTGSGKTYAIEGSGSTNRDSTASGDENDAARGIIPRLAEDLFRSLAIARDADAELVSPRAAATTTGGPRLVSGSASAEYFEIYQERVTDLLVPPKSALPAPVTSPTLGLTRMPSSRPGATRQASSSSLLTSSTSNDADIDGVTTAGGLALRQRPDGEVYVENATGVRVASAADVLRVIAEGGARRTRAETNMNAASSRSHAVLILRLVLNFSDGTERTSKLHVIDLAGSERADSTGARGERLREGASINKSLAALGGVIAALTSPGRAHVPYRDSKLTRLLQDSLGGNSVTTMLCCVTMASSSYDETLSSLRFASRAKQIKNIVHVNVDAAAHRIATLAASLRASEARVESVERALALRLGIQWPISEEDSTSFEAAIAVSQEGAVWATKSLGVDNPATRPGSGGRMTRARPGGGVCAIM